jgi:predicted Zn-dependent protease
MPQSPGEKLTPDAARRVLSGELPLSALLGVSTEQIAGMASLGHQFWKQGRRREAQKMFRALVALDEKSYYGHAGLGLVAMEEEDLAAAEEHLRTALALQPHDAAVAVNLGEVLLRQGKLEAAILALDAAAQLDATGTGGTRARAILTGIGRGAAEVRKKPAGTAR